MTNTTELPAKEGVITVSLPQGWSRTTTGCVAEIDWGNTSITKSSYRETGFTAFSATGPDGFLDHFEHDGTGIVLSAIGARCGKCFFANGKWSAIKNTITIISKLPDGVINEFLFYLLNKPDFWPNRGGAQPFITLGDARKLEIPIPPAREQQRIVAALDERLSELDASVASLERAERNLVRYRAAVLAAACFGKLVPTEADLAYRAGRTYEPADQLLARILAERRKVNTKAKYEEPAQPDISKLPKLPEGWVSATVEQVSSQIVDCPHSTAKFTAAGHPCLDTTCIKPGRVVREKLRYVSDTIYEERIARLKPATQDIVFAREGTVGTAVSIPADISPCLGQRVMLMRSSACITPAYYECVLNSDVIKNQYRSKIVGSTAPHLNVADVRVLAIPLPPLAEQERIVAEVDRHLSRADALAASIAQSKRRAQRLRRAILAAAFQGRLVPQDPHDEPASVLLDRIRAQAATVGAASAAAPRRGRPSTPARAAEPVAIYEAPASKRRGRPPGAKNKAKA